MRKFVKIITIVLCLTAFFTIGGCSVEKDPGEPKTVMPQSTVEPTIYKEGEPVYITITMADGGVMKFDLFHDKAPKTVENFVNLAKAGFYDGLTFHRIVKGFMIQGGDPEGTGFGGSDKTIPGEFAANGFPENNIRHIRGVISMARSQNPDSASSQFFIVHEDSTFLDGQYAAFGVLVEGEDVLDRIANTRVYGETPVAKPVIQSITVE